MIASEPFTMKKANSKVKPKAKSKVKSILISQPKPESERSPYFDLASKFNVRMDFFPFIRVEGIHGKDFRKDKIVLTDYSAVIFNSRNAIDHFFRICEELRTRMQQDTKYFCISEAVALYLQKYILYRKRKVFYGNGTERELENLLLKHKDGERFLFPCSDVHKEGMCLFLEEKGFAFDKAVIYKTVSSDLSELKKLKYDIMVFFSPLGVKSLFENFPKFKQGNTKIAALGKATAKAVQDAGMKLNIEAPVPEAPSMATALENYLVTTGKK